MTWLQKRQKSFDVLDQYKKELSPDQHRRIKQTIGNSAIENMFSTQKSIHRMVRFEKGEATGDELVQEVLVFYKNKR